MKGKAAVCPFCFPKAEEAETVLCTGWQCRGPGTQAGGICPRCQSITRPGWVGKPLSMWAPLSHDPL